MTIAGTRHQRTIERAASVRGIGFFGGNTVNLTFMPADENHGIVFQRTDLPGAPTIPARIEFCAESHRRTTISNGDAHVELVEHVLAALAGLQIDNCLVALDSPEAPGCDGSCREFCDRLLTAGIVSQSEPAASLTLRHPIHISDRTGCSEIRARPLVHRRLAVTYHLDYGSRSPIQPQTLTYELTPQSFAQEIAFARTFILESEIQSLKERGYGRRTTARDLLVFGAHGVVDNRLRSADECVRHKILDCIGDLALLGCDVYGHINAWRSGHELNRVLAGQIRATHNQAVPGLPRTKSA